MAGILLRRQHEFGNAYELNARMQNYISDVRGLREQNSRIASADMLNMTKALEDEVVHLKNLYENELQALRAQLEELGREKNQQQLAASQNATKVAALEEKLADETTTRKKVENLCGDAQRVIAEKDRQLEEANVAITMEQNAHLDTKKEKESLQNQLSQTQDLYSAEAAARGDFENLCSQLKDKLEFDRQRYEQELWDLTNRCQDIETALRMAEERIHEHNIIDEDLAMQLAKVKSQSQAELKRYQEEAQMNFQNSLDHCKYQLEQESKKLSEANDENIRLKAKVEALSTRVTNAEAKAAATDCQNHELIQELEAVRKTGANEIQALEGKCRNLQEDLNTKIRDLSAAYNCTLPINCELDAMAALLDAEGRRLKIATTEPPQVVTRAQFLARADTAPKSSQSAPFVGVKPFRRTSSPKMSRPSSVQQLPPVVDAPGQMTAQKSNPEPVQRRDTVGDNSSWSRQVAGNGGPSSRRYSRYYALNQPTRVQQHHKRFPTN